MSKIKLRPMDSDGHIYASGASYEDQTMIVTRQFV